MATKKKPSSRSGSKQSASGSKRSSSSSKSRSTRNSGSKQRGNKSKSGRSSSRSGSSKQGSKKQGSKPQALQNPSQEAAGHVGDEGHARVRPSQTRSVSSGSNDRSSSRRSRKREEFKYYSVAEPNDISGGPHLFVIRPARNVCERHVHL